MNYIIIEDNYHKYLDFYVKDLILDNHFGVINWCNTDTADMSLFLSSIDQNSIVYFNQLNPHHKFHIFAKKFNLRIGYNALVHTEFCEIEVNLSFLESFYVSRLSKFLRIVCSKIWRCIIKKSKPRFHEIVKYTDTNTKSLLVSGTFDTVRNIDRMETRKLFFSESPKNVYVIDSAQDSHLDLLRDGFKSVPSIIFINKHLNLIKYIKNNFPNSKIYFIKHPRRGNIEILKELHYPNTIFFSEIKYNEMKNAIFFSGASALALQLFYDGFNLNFINLFPGYLDSYYLEHSNFSYISIS